VKRASEDVHEEYFLCPEEKYYLRSLGDDPRKDISDITVLFPTLAQDINIPKLYPEDRFFSSVFRISSLQGQLWTHYHVSTLEMRANTYHSTIYLTFIPESQEVSQSDIQKNCEL